MPDLALATPEPVLAPLDLSQNRETEKLAISENKVNFSSHSTLKHLTGFSTNLSIETTGEELGQMFKQQPDLPGVILFDGQQFTGIISQAYYYKCISRPFGREVYYRRPSSVMLADINAPALILLSDCAIQAAVDKCIARPGDFIYEPFLVHDQERGEYKLCAFHDLLIASSQLANLRNRQMEQILNSVTDGLLVIDKNFQIGGEYSKAVGKLFERTDLGETTLPAVLKPLLDETTHEQVHDYLKVLFDRKLIDRLIKSINPAKQISASFPSSDPKSPEKTRAKHFAFNFERIRIGGEISQVLVRIEDITQQINLAKELQEQEAASEEKLHLVMQILRVQPEALNRFIEHYDEMLDRLFEIFDLPEGPVSKDVIHALFRQVHTIKGEAAMLGFGTHEKALHKLEDELSKLRENPDLQKSDVASVRQLAGTVQTQCELIHEAIDQLKGLGVGAGSVSAATSSSAPVKANGLIETLSRLVSDLGERLNKGAIFHTALSNTDFPPEHADILNEALIHLVRNSMVHGIEPGAERTARGKNAEGLIQLDLRAHDEFHEVIFQDDGRGLDYEKIRQRAEQLGWKLSSDEELRMAIFEPGFSTAEKVTELAGRGVGLDVIRHSLQKVGGRIIPYSEPGSYCAFQILLPKTSPPEAA
jgi:signal transduction histidine kinase